MALLHLLNSRRPSDSETTLAAAADDDLVMFADEAATVTPAAADVLAAVAVEFPRADAVFGDAVIAGRQVRRAGWSPTRTITDPTSVLPLAVRARSLRLHRLQPADPTVALALAAADASVVHVPTVLSHHPGPPTGPTLDQIAGHVAELGWPVEVEPGPRPQTFRLRPSGSRPPLSIVIPTAGTRTDATGPRIVDRCLAALAPELGHDDEVLIVVGDEFEGDPGSIVVPASLAARVIDRPRGEFNFSAAINQGVLAARHGAVLLLNDDTDAPTSGFADAMSAHLSDPSVGAVGALLTYPDGRLQHAGLVIDDARPLHPFVGCDPSVLSRHSADIAHDVIAVTGACLLARRRDFLAVGGMSTRFPLSFNDVDICLRLRRGGHRVIMEPAAGLTHHEGGSRSPRIDHWEWDRWIDRWGSVEDPWYHPGHGRPDDPDRLHRNADHLDPHEPFESRVGRDTMIRPRVHHARLA